MQAEYRAAEICFGPWQLLAGCELAFGSMPVNHNLRRIRLPKIMTEAARSGLK
jgi:hypothetical protein